MSAFDNLHRSGGNQMFMKTFNSLPQDHDFFSRYQNVISALRKIRTPTQIISAFTAIGVLFFWAKSAMADYLPEMVVPWLAALVAFLIAFMIEIVLRVSVGKSFQQILYKRFAGLDLLMTIIIFLLALAAIASSGVTSFQGSKKVVQAFKNPPALQTTVFQDSLYAVRLAEIRNAFSVDSGNIATRFADQFTAKEMAHNATIEAKRSELKLIKKLPGETWSDYNRKKNTVNTSVKALEAARDGELSDLKAQRDGLLFEREKARDAELKEIDGEHKAEIAEVKTKNSATTKEFEDTIQSEGVGLGWVTVGCLLFFLLGSFADEVHKKGSGIEETVKQSWWDNLPTIWAEFWHALSERLQSALRGQIVAIENKSKGPVLPTIPSEVMKFDNLNQTVLNITNDEDKVNVKAPKRRQIGFFSENNNVPFTAHETEHRNTVEDPVKHTGNPDLSDILQRIKLYKKRVGHHEQKAIVQKRKNGVAAKRTMEAIANNKQWVEHWEQELKKAQDQAPH